MDTRRVFYQSVVLAFGWREEVVEEADARRVLDVLDGDEVCLGEDLRARSARAGGRGASP